MAMNKNGVRRAFRKNWRRFLANAPWLCKLLALCMLVDEYGFEATLLILLCLPFIDLYADRNLERILNKRLEHAAMRAMKRGRNIDSSRFVEKCAYVIARSHGSGTTSKPVVMTDVYGRTTIGHCISQKIELNGESMLDMKLSSTERAIAIERPLFCIHLEHPLSIKVERLR